MTDETSETEPTEDDSESEMQKERQNYRPVRPDQIPLGHDPAYVKLENPRSVSTTRDIHVADYRTQDNGWLYTAGWDGSREMFPPERVVSITPLDVGVVVNDANGGLPPYKTLLVWSEFYDAAREYKRGVRRVEDDAALHEWVFKEQADLDAFDAEHGRGKGE